MVVRRIVANFGANDPAKVRPFYEALFDLDVVMDLGWIVTLASKGSAQAQISLMSEGGSGAPVPDISVEVDDVDEAHRRAVAAKAEIVHALVDEPWGVRRFFVRDPLGRVVNVLSHRQ
jgi:predicted enzyme related to lactoylglutathione lyase